jgi:hypothetical protein
VEEDPPDASYLDEYYALGQSRGRARGDPHLCTRPQGLAHGRQQGPKVQIPRHLRRTTVASGPSLPSEANVLETHPFTSDLSFPFPFRLLSSGRTGHIAQTIGQGYTDFRESVAFSLPLVFHSIVDARSCVRLSGAHEWGELVYGYWSAAYRLRKSRLVRFSFFASVSTEKMKKAPDAGVKSIRGQKADCSAKSGATLSYHSQSPKHSSPQIAGKEKPCTLN